MKRDVPHFNSALDLPLREKIAQLVFVRIGSNLPPVRTVEEDEERIAGLLDQCPVGGLVLFNGGPDTKPALDRLQKRSPVPLLVASDIERGVGQQVKGNTLFPHAMAFGKMSPAEGDVAVVEFARVLAHEARDVGIHITLGPVADVSTNPRNPIIATRAFSDDVDRASELVAAFVKAVQSRGLLATAKHFPGHGDTSLDSHATLPTVTHSRQRLAGCELAPFRAAIQAGCQLIMTAHVSYPALDPTGSPATLSPAILTGLLRGEMGFQGVVCSDSLLMAGVRERFDSEGEIAQVALAAGVDVLVDVNDPFAVVDHLCKCVASGSLDEARIDEAAMRVAALKEQCQDVSPETVTPNCAEVIARRAVQLIGDKNNVPLPLNCDVPLGAVLLKPFETHLDPPEQPLAAALRERFSCVKYAQLGPTADADTSRAAADLVRDCPQLLVAVVVRPAAWHRFGLLPAQTDFAHRLLREHSGAVLASLGVPQVLEDFPEASLRVCTFSDVPVSQRALAKFLAT
jgi:beta-glucosidase-like glycosyl hydrolase